MNQIEKIKNEHFFRNVLIYLGIYGWRIRWVQKSSDGYCWKSRKVIDIGENNNNVRELILHEISHIRTCRFCNNKHNYGFWAEFDRLMRKFLPNESWSESSLLHIKYQGGYNRLCYEDRNG